MTIQDVYFENYQIFISSKNFQDFLSTLNIGDVVKGRVLENLGSGKFLINFSGHNVISSSELSLRKADTIQAQVTDIADKVTMRLLPGNVAPEGEKLSEDDFNRVLEQLNLKSSSTNLDIVKALSLFDIQLSKENILAMQQKMKELNLSSFDDLKALAYLTSKQFPATAESTKSIKAYLFEENLIGKNLENVEQGLKKLAPFLDSSKVEGFVGLLNKMKIRVDEGSLMEQLSRFMENSGLNYESKVKNLFFSKEFMENIAGEQKDFSVGGEVKELFNSIQGLIKGFVGSPDMESSRLAKEIQEVLAKGISDSVKLEKLILNLLELSRNEKGLDTKQFFDNLERALIKNGDPKLLKQYKTLQTLNNVWNQIKNDTASADGLKDFMGTLAKDVKYFFYTGSEKVLQKIDHKLEFFFKHFEGKSENLLKLKEIFNDIAQGKKESLISFKDKELSLEKLLADRRQSHDVGAEKILNIREDLKGSLLQIKEYLNLQARNNPGILKDTNFGQTAQIIDKTINLLSGEQLANLKAEDNYVYFSFQVPLHTKEATDTAKISVYYRKQKDKQGKGDDKDDTVRIALFLDMRNLGPVKILVDVGNRIINCQIKVMDEKIRNYINGNINDLASDLKSLDFELGTISCVIEKREKIEDFASEIREEAVFNLNKIDMIV